MEIKHFETEFVERTIYILKNYDDEYLLSNSINCTLGLLFLPNEFISETAGTIWEKQIKDIKELDFLKIRLFKPIRYQRKGITVYSPPQLKFLLRKIRDGFAHQYIEPKNTKGRFTRFILKNYFPNRKGTLDTEIEFTEPELRRFSLFIADQYLAMQQEK